MTYGGERKADVQVSFPGTCGKSFPACRNSFFHSHFDTTLKRMINHHFFRVFAVVFAVWVLLLVGFKSRIVLAHRYECEFRTFVEFPRNGSLWYLTSIRSSEMRDRCLIGPEPLSTSFPIPFHVNPHFVPEVSFYVCFGNKKRLSPRFRIHKSLSLFIHDAIRLFPSNNALHSTHRFTQLLENPPDMHLSSHRRRELNLPFSLPRQNE